MTYNESEHQSFTCFTVIFCWEHVDRSCCVTNPAKYYEGFTLKQCLGWLYTSNNIQSDPWFSTLQQSWSMSLTVVVSGHSELVVLLLIGSCRHKLLGGLYNYLITTTDSKGRQKVHTACRVWKMSDDGKAYQDWIFMAAGCDWSSLFVSLIQISFLGKNVRSEERNHFNVSSPVEIPWMIFSDFEPCWTLKFLHLK